MSVERTARAAPLPRPRSGTAARSARSRGTSEINLASNDYLGLSRHPDVTRAAAEAIERYGVGSAASRQSARTKDLHERLERRLAEFKRVPAVVTLQSGFAAVMAALSTLTGSQDLVVSDELGHPSTADGVRLGGGEHRTFRHRDADDLDQVLRRARGGPRRYGRILVATDAVFGHDGEIAPLPAIYEVAERHGAELLVDEAHALGVLGDAGRGAIAHYGLGDRPHVQVGTLSKAVGALGGYVAGTEEVRGQLLMRSRQVLYSTLQSPPIVAACIAAIDVIERDEARRERLWANTRSFKGGLTRLGLDIGRSETPITPIYLGDAARTSRAALALRERGVIAAALVPPSVPEGRARLRTIMGSEHTEAEIACALEVIEEVARHVGAL